MAESSKQLRSLAWTYEMTNKLNSKAGVVGRWKRLRRDGQKCRLFRLADTVPATVAENQTTDARLSSYEMNVNDCNSKKIHSLR